MDNMNILNDYEIFAITDDSLRYSECVHCYCRMCINMLTVCRYCFVCEFDTFPNIKCRWFVPFVFGSEPYKSYFRELEKLRGVEYDIIGRFE